MQALLSASVLRGMFEGKDLGFIFLYACLSPYSFLGCGEQLLLRMDEGGIRCGKSFGEVSASFTVALSLIEKGVTASKCETMSNVCWRVFTFTLCSSSSFPVFLFVPPTLINREIIRNVRT